MIRSIGKKNRLTSQECNDLLVDVMFIFWKKMDQFLYDPDRGKFRNYLSKIAHFSIFRIIMARNMKKPPVQQEEYPPEIDEKYMEEWKNYLLENALKELKSSIDTDTYQVFYMSFFQERPVEEICAVTRKTRDNVYVIRSRCLKKLKKIIQTYRKYEEEGLPVRTDFSSDEAEGTE